VLAAIRIQDLHIPKVRIAQFQSFTCWLHRNYSPLPASKDSRRKKVGDHI